MAAVVAVVAVIAAACGGGSVAGGSSDAASVGGTALSRSDLNEILTDLPDTEGSTVDATVTSSFLSNWLFITALGQELEARGYSVSQADIDEATAQIEASAGSNPSSPLGLLQISQRAIQLSADPYIEHQLSQLDTDVVIPEYLCSSHILLDTREEADAVGQRLAAGEDFAALAAEVSTGPSGPNGGDLGCVDTSSFVQEFIEGASVVAPSGLTGPVESQFGFHVIQVRSMGPLSAENHPEMSQVDIDSALAASTGNSQSGQREIVVEGIIADVNARVTESVAVDPRYGEWDGSVGVVAPAGVTSDG